MSSSHIGGVILNASISLSLFNRTPPKWDEVIKILVVLVAVLV